MATLPRLEQLDQRTPSPQAGAVSYRATSGQEEAPSEAASKFGEVVQNLAFEKQDQLNTTRAEDAWNRYKSAALDLSVGQNGFATKKAGDAVNGNLFQNYSTAMQDTRKAIDGTLQDDDVRRRFNERANITDLQFKDSLLRHYTTERTAYEKQTFDGSVAAASSMVAAAPLDQGIFDTAMLNLNRRAEQLAQHQGITDQGSIDKIKDTLKDTLLTKRLESLLYSNPAAADDLFRLTSDQITSPEVKLNLQSKIREASLGVRSTNTAADIMAEVRGAQPPERPQKQSYAPPTPGFEGAVTALLQREGGFVAKDGKSGAPANYGINQAANPDIDVASLTPAKAKDIYRVRYWNAINGDALPPATAMVALDTAALQGVGVAQKLITDTGGDPTAMISARRDQLIALAANDPEHAKQLPGWLARLDGLQAQVAPLPPNTSGLPNSRDIKAQLPLMLAKVEERADKLYGNDPNNPDRAAFVARTTNELRSKINLDAVQLDAIQKQSQGTLIDYIAGFKGNTPVTSFSQIQGDPNMMRAWQMTDPAAKLGLERLIESNARGDTAGNQALYWDVFKKIHQDPGTPGKVDFYQQILGYAGPGKLSMQQIGQLRQEIDRNETPGGRSVGQMMRNNSTQVATYFKTTPMFTMQPDRQMAATMKWTEDVGKKVDEYAKSGKDARTLFMSDTPDSMVKPDVLQTYVNSTPPAGLADMAARTKAQADQPPVRLDPKNPNQTFNMLLPGARYVGPDGVVRTKPGSGK